MDEDFYDEIAQTVVQRNPSAELNLDYPVTRRRLAERKLARSHCIYRLAIVSDLEKAVRVSVRGDTTR